MDSKTQLGVYLDTWDFGGISNLCFSLAQGFQEAGVEVTLLLARDHKPRDPLALGAFEEMCARKKFAAYDLRLNKLPRRARNSALVERVKKLNLDIIVISNFANYLPAFNALACHSRLISMGHGDHSQSYSLFHSSQYFVHRHIAISQAIVESCAEMCPPQWQYKVALRHHGVPVPKEIAPLTVGNGPVRAAYCGRLDFSDKRLQDLPVLWQRFVELGGQGELTIIGDGEAGGWLKTQFKSEIEKGSVRFTGYQQGVALEEELREQEIILNLSNWEGLSLSVIEAVMRGCYPILSKVRSGHSEIVRVIGGGTLCHVGDCEGFARALLDFQSTRVEKVKEREKLREEAIRHFSVQTMIAGYRKLFAEVLAEPLLEPAPHLGIPPATVERGFWDFLRGNSNPRWL